MIEAGYNSLGSSFQVKVGLRDLPRDQRINILFDLLRETGLENLIATNPEVHREAVKLITEYRKGD